VYEECRRRFFPRLPLWAEVLAVIGLGLGGPIPWLVSIGRGYETAIACGYALVMCGSYLLLRGLRDLGRPRLLPLALGSASLGLAVGARPNLVVFAVFVCLAAVVASRNRSSRAGRSVPLLASLFAPYAMVGLLLGVYNHARFGSFTEFGYTYQLAGMRMPSYPFGRVRYLFANLVDYLSLRPVLMGRFPYVRLQPNNFDPDFGHHSHEPVAGALVLFPSIIAGLGVSALRAKSLFSRSARGLGWLLVAGSAVALFEAVSISLRFHASTMRYSVDFAPLLILVATIGWSWCFGRSPRGELRSIVLAGVWIASVATAVAVGVALVLTPCPGTGSC
jgi:hypothetical protein